MADKAFSSGKVHDTLKNKATPDEVATHMKHEASRARFRIISLIALLIGILIMAYYLFNGWWSSNVREAYVGDKVSITFAACPGVIQEVIYNDPTKSDKNYEAQMEYASVTAYLCDLPMDEDILGKRSTWVTNAGSDWRSKGDAFCGSVSAALGDGERECTADSDCYQFMYCDPNKVGTSDDCPPDQAAKAQSDDCPCGIECREVKRTDVHLTRVGNHYCDYANLGDANDGDGPRNKDLKSLFKCAGIGKRDDGTPYTYCIINNDDNKMGLVCPNRTCNLGGYAMLDNASADGDIKMSSCNACQDLAYTDPSKYFECMTRLQKEMGVPVSASVNDIHTNVTSVSSPCTGCEVGQWCVASGIVGKDGGIMGNCTGTPKTPTVLRVQFEAQGTVVSRTPTDEGYAIEVNWERVQCKYPWPAMNAQGDYVISDNPDAYHQGCMLNLNAGSLTDWTRNMLFGYDPSDYPSSVTTLSDGSVDCRTYCMNNTNKEAGSMTHCRGATYVDSTGATQSLHCTVTMPAGGKNFQCDCNIGNKSGDPLKGDIDKTFDFPIGDGTPYTGHYLWPLTRTLNVVGRTVTLRANDSVDFKVIDDYTIANMPMVSVDEAHPEDDE